MDTNYNNKLWGVADFERYHTGTMPALERHALEKAALDDPFLQDALDGYQFTASPARDIVDLKERLWPSTNKTPVVTMPWYKTNTASKLFKAAAVVILFGGLGWLYVNRNNKPGAENTEFATKDLKPGNNTLDDSSASSIYPLNDTAPVVAKLDKEIPQSNIAKTEPEKTAVANASENKIAAEAEELARNNEKQKDNRQYSLDDSRSKKAMSNKEISNAAPTLKNQNQISGRVINQQGEPVPNAIVKNNVDAGQAVVSDREGNFVMNNATENNKAVQVEVNAAGYEKRNQQITNNSSNNSIVLKEADDHLSEVATTAANAKKEKYQWNSRNSRIQLRNAKPLEGWDYFYYVMNDSISNNKLLMQSKGRMILSFNVNDSGKLMQIEVKKSLNKTADSIAQKILLNSPVIELNNPQKRGEAIIKIN